MANPFTIYQLTILYMLDRSSFPLSNTQITGFFLEREYTDYFRVQEVLSDLTGSALILPRKSYGNTQYVLTKEGRNTLHYQKDKLSEEIAADIRDYFANNQLEFRQDNSVTADYHRTEGGKYAVCCQVLSDGNPVIDLTLSANTKEQAQTMCDHWKTRNEEVYACLMDLLLQ